MRKSGFPPVIDKNTEIVILGSLPSDMSILKGEYYANPKNQFWRIIFAIFNNNEPLYKYNERITLLLKNKIGLWDVLTEADREGSLDSNIQSEVLNDFSGLFTDYPKIRKLAFNGDKAFKCYLKMRAGLPQKEMVRMTSSSSANTSKSISLKIKEWEITLK
ncbi:MAG: DNA-deoxyinosine glycosylase [Bacteroidetes bacterium]|nr:DNA-deoxyinosine glycosylase [Bacteroidota bacterium]